jgi:hypothetical protein
MVPASAALTLFMDGLRSLGFQPVKLPDRSDCVVFDYIVESGKFTGRAVRLGLIVPADFPNTTPTGPHVSPNIHLFAQNGEHPTGGIHQQHAVPFQTSAGGQWQYWSRPFPGWAEARKTVAVYMSHIWRLWDTQ